MRHFPILKLPFPKDRTFQVSGRDVISMAVLSSLGCGPAPSLEGQALDELIQDSVIPLMFEAAWSSCVFYIQYILAMGHVFCTFWNDLDIIMNGAS